MYAGELVEKFVVMDLCLIYQLDFAKSVPEDSIATTVLKNAAPQTMEKTASLYVNVLILTVILLLDVFRILKLLQPIGN